MTPRRCSTSRSRSRDRASSPSSARRGSRSASSPTCSRPASTSTSPSGPARPSEVEDQALRWVGEFVGFPAEAGAFTSGGTVSNVTALAAARERALPGSRRTGVGGAHGALYCSTEAHYSVVRSAELLGLGSASVRSLPHRRAAPARPGGGRAGDRRRPRGRRGAGRGRRDSGHDADRRGRPDRRRSPTCAPRATSGCTSTAPTACRPRRRRRPGTSSPGSSAPTR